MIRGPSPRRNPRKPDRRRRRREPQCGDKQARVGREQYASEQSRIYVNVCVRYLQNWLEYMRCSPFYSGIQHTHDGPNTEQSLSLNIQSKRANASGRNVRKLANRAEEKNEVLPSVRQTAFIPCRVFLYCCAADGRKKQREADAPLVRLGGEQRNE